MYNNKVFFCPSMDCSLTFGSCLFVGTVKRVNKAKKSMMEKKSRPPTEKEVAIIPTRRNTEERRRVLIGTECSSAIYLMT